MFWALLIYSCFPSKTPPGNLYLVHHLPFMVNRNNCHLAKRIFVLLLFRLTGHLKEQLNFLWKAFTIVLSCLALFSVFLLFMENVEGLIWHQQFLQKQFWMKS